MTKYWGLLFLMTILGCSRNRDNVSMDMMEEAVPETSEQRLDEIVERKLIKEGQVEFETHNLGLARKNIFEAVTKYNGYVSSDQEFNSPGRKSNTIIIRVPADNFDKLLAEATLGVNKFEIKEINVKDVTEEFLDIQARLKTKKELEGRYLDLLKQAKNVVEILEIEKQIGALRTEIESTEGRMKYLQNRVSFSTLTMNFYESMPTQTEFGRQFKNVFKNGWHNFIMFFVVLTNMWPFILIGLGIIIGIKFYRRKRK